SIIRAVAPSLPDHDRRVLFTILALLGAASLGAAGAFMRASLTSNFHEAGDVAKTVHAPFLGAIPILSERERTTGLDVASIQSECIRMVRTALLERLNGRGGGVVQITSAGPNAGKTTLSVLLARSMAQCGKRVLLVDADVRQPTVALRMGIPPGPGLIGVL